MVPAKIAMSGSFITVACTSISRRKTQQVREIPDKHTPDGFRTGEKELDMKASIARKLNTLKDSVPSSARPDAGAFECGYCHLDFDGDRLNCPACGGPVIQRA